MLKSKALAVDFIVFTRVETLFGKDVLLSEEYRLKCLKENKLKSSKGLDLARFYIDEKRSGTETSQALTSNSSLETLFDPKNPAPIPAYSIFNYNN